MCTEINGMKNIIIQLLSLLCAVFLLSCKKQKEDHVQFTVYKANGNITAKLDEFRSSLGALNTMPGAVGGRREINWDGIPDSLLNRSLPNNFFNTVGIGVPSSRQRGLIYDGGEFQVSADNFFHLNQQAATEFAPFSGNKVFANTTALDWPNGFQVPGENTTASVKAFGMVFCDVDVEGSVSLEFFEGNKSLGLFIVPAHNDAGKFSFLGVEFHNRRITRVKVHHQGKLVDGEKDISQGGTADLIILDDFIYSEPEKWEE